MMQVIKLAVEPRTETGKGAARKLRRTGMVPGVLYRDGNEPLMFAFDAEELESSLRKRGDRNALIEVAVEGDKRICLIKDFQRHPLSRRIRHMDFYEVLEDRMMVVKVRVEPLGTAAGTKLGGQLNVLRRTLDVRCLPIHIPTSITFDVSELEVGDFVRVAQIEVPDNTTILYESNFNVLSVEGKRLSTEFDIEEEEEEEGEGTEGEADDASAEA
jgi:large subunit ribosomal protein L25